jgi:signal transduction histidine kinase
LGAFRTRRKCLVPLPPPGVPIPIRRSAAGSMSDVLNNVLQMSAIEAGALTVAPGPADVGELVRSLTHQLQPWAAGVRASLTAEVDPALPALVAVDRPRLQQVVANFA